MADKNLDEFILLYESVLNDISYYKNQQWSVTNYIILIYAAIVFIFQSLESVQILTFEKIILFVLVLFIMVFGFIVINKFDKDLYKSRKQKRKTREYFSNDFQSNFIDENSEIKKSSMISYVLRAVIIIGGLFVSYILLRSFFFS